MKVKSGENLDAYVERLPSPQKEIVEALLKLVRDAAPGLRETINP